MKAAHWAVVAALLLLSALFPAGATAAYDPLGSGTTRLSLDKSFTALLKQNGVQLTGEGGVVVRGNAVIFPVSGGKFDPTTAKGAIEHGGALRLRAGRRSVPVRALQLKTTQRHSPFAAKVGGGQLKIAAAQKMAVRRAGFGSRVETTALTLSAKFAERLDKKLHLRGIFAADQPFGATVTRAEPVTVAVAAAEKVSFTLDPAIAAKLQSLFVAVNPIFPAEHLGPVFSLPIFDGAIAPDATLGTLRTKGSLEFLQLGGGQVFWHEPSLELATKVGLVELDVEPAPPYAGKVGPVAVGALTLTSVSADPQARTIAMSAALALEPAAAVAFNQAFAEGKETFRPGEALGTLSFVAHAQ